MPYKNYADHLAFRRRYKKTATFKKCTQFYDSAKHANQRAAKYGVPGHINATDVRLILHPQARCYYCDRLASETDEVFGRRELGIDHVISMFCGGPNIPSNIVPCCHSCNARKYIAESPTAWASTFPNCIACGETARRHSARGLCSRCYQREKSANRRERVAGQIGHDR